MNPVRMLNSICRPCGVRGVTKALIFCCAGLGGLPAAEAMECPLPQLTNSTGVIRESRQTIAELSSAFAQRGTGATRQIIISLRRKYPDSTGAELTDYLITAYCPVVNRNSALSDKEKIAAVKRFADQVSEKLQ